MTFQAVIDDSFDTNGAFVLAGYIADADAWARFSEEWQALLPLAPVGRSGVRRFRMAEMGATEDRMAHVPAFFRVIERHVLASISAKIDIADLRRAQSRILVPGLEIDWDKFSNPYFVAFRCLMDKFHAERPYLTEWLPADRKIDFYFDNHAEEDEISKMWGNYLNERSSKTREFYGAAPIFKDAEEFLPLQAADFWAWWVRKWYREGTPEKILRWGFDSFEPLRQRKYLRIEIAFDEDELASTMMSVLRNQIGPRKPIIDLHDVASAQGVVS